jgi:fructose-bisphosphate aldolase class II
VPARIRGIVAVPLATLDDVLRPAMARGYAVAGMVVLGWEDACAFVQAAEAERAPVILQAGPACRAHTPLPVLAAMFRTLAERSTVPVVAHLDHGHSAQECQEAIDLGFTSVMFDGSRLPLTENIARTAAIVKRASAAGVSVEGEIGFVGYAGGETSRGTDPEEARRFAVGTGVTAMAISIGNVHLQRGKEGEVDVARLRAIEATTGIPLVIHGGSGIPPAVRHDLSTTSRICKFNIGTELRIVFGKALRRVLEEDPTEFDRIAILAKVMPDLRDAARGVLRSLASDGRA